MCNRALDLSLLEEAIGYQFKDRSLLKIALTHSSADKHKHGKPWHNERMEFLGDQVLGLCISTNIFHEHKDEDEGYLSKRLAALVRKETCAHVARNLELDKYMTLGNGETAAGRVKSAIVADALEALIAAIYLEGGLPAAKTTIDKLWSQEMPPIRLKDGKSMLQEYLQGKSLPLPVYEVSAIDGEDHKRLYQVTVTGANQTATGKGTSKQKAQQAAADALLKKLGIEIK